MLGETTFGAVGMLILLFLITIAFLIIIAYGFGLKKIEKRRVNACNLLKQGLNMYELR